MRTRRGMVGGMAARMAVAMERRRRVRLVKLPP
jgi:hypothetical protein